MMKCKDIPDVPVLRFLTAHGGIGCTAWRTDDGKPRERSVLNAMPENVPEKLARAKMAMLIRRELVAGCLCGCRGDFSITKKGTSMLKSLDESSEMDQ